jgi:FkbM family methyltransferase
MPHFNLRYFLETLGKRHGEDVFILQVGAMDGQTFDPVHEYITRFNWAGLLIEPLADQFARLQETYKSHPRVRCANVAIGEELGTVMINRIPPELLDNEDMPKWGVGASSFYTDRNALAFNNIKPLIQQEAVHCTPLPSLLHSFDIGQVDVLQIDAEGHDYHILKQFDFECYHPMVIHMEIINLPKAEQNASKRLLDQYGYLHAKTGYDLLAVSPRFFMEAAP